MDMTDHTHMDNNEQQFPNLSKKPVSFLHDMVRAVSEGICPLPDCHKPIYSSEFRDEISLREYRISGLCQACQDKIFSAMTDEMDNEFDQEPQE